MQDFGVIHPVLLWYQLKREGRARLVIRYVHPVQPIPNSAGVIELDGIRKGKVLAQLGRVDGVGEEVTPLTPLVKGEFIPPPAGRRVALGQQKLNDGAQAVGARVVAAPLGGKFYFRHDTQTKYRERGRV
jgi:hypothetical protein